MLPCRGCQTHAEVILPEMAGALDPQLGHGDEPTGYWWTSRRYGPEILGVRLN